MATKKRYNLKRRASKVFGHLDNCMADIQYLHTEFDGIKPEHAKLLELIGIMLIQVETTLEEFTMQSWKASKDSLESYRK